MFVNMVVASYLFPRKSVTDIFFVKFSIEDIAVKGGGLHTWFAVKTAEFPLMVLPITIPDPLELTDGFSPEDSGKSKSIDIKAKDS